MEWDNPFVKRPPVTRGGHSDGVGREAWLQRVLTAASYGTRNM